MNKFQNLRPIIFIFFMLPGQICAQMAKHSGAKIIAIDMHNSRLQMGADNGYVDVGLNAGEGKIAERIKEIDPDSLTPRQALSLIYELRKHVKDGGEKEDDRAG